MPLVRFAVRNEYGLGDPEMYRAPATKDDSKALLDGVAVAGLVGILRQLGDLAELAADVFHDLHEQVTATAARGRKMMTRIQNIETALPSVEKAIREQTSHIHFAYVRGSEWHAHLGDAQNLLLSSELPHFMMDSYEECRDPPRLYLLDKFDNGGAGACLKRYSDPSYFRRVWTVSELEKAENTAREKKIQKMKRKSSQIRNREYHHANYLSQHDSRTRFASPSMDGQSFSNENVSTADIRLHSEVLSRSTSFGSKAREGYAERGSDVNLQMAPDEVEYIEVPDSMLQRKDSVPNASEHTEPSVDCLDDVSHDSLQEKSVPRSSSVTWDEKAEIVMPTGAGSCDDIMVDGNQNSDSQPVSSEQQNIDISKIEASKRKDIFDTSKVLIPLSGMNHFNEITSETDNYMDALNTLESETETEADCQSKREVNPPCDMLTRVREPGIGRREYTVVPNTDSSDNEAPNASVSTINQDAAPRFSNLSSSDSLGNMQSPHTADCAQDQEFSVSNVSSERSDCDKRKDHDGANNDCSPETATSSSETTVHDETTAKKFTLECSPLSNTSGLPPIQLWTNGGLFGVEPSKPPDLGLVNISNENLILDSGNSAHNLSSYTANTTTLIKRMDGKSDATFMHNETILEDSVSAAKKDNKFTSLCSSSQGSSNGNQLSASSFNVVQPNDTSECSSFFHNTYPDDSFVKNSLQLPMQPLSLLEKSREISSSSNDVISHGLEMLKTSATYSTGTQNGSSQSTKIISSTFSDLAQRFLANTLKRKASLTSTTAPFGKISSGDIRKSEDTCHANDHRPSEVDTEASYEENAKGKTGHGSLKKSSSLSSHFSGQSSPPLEHMKISFQPMNGLETSEMKLDLSDGSFHKNRDDFVLQSFQLTQNSVDPLPYSCSESDDDTFCRSCPYSSEELLSPGSYSNSEIWEQEERSEYKNDELCDATHRFPSSETSISNYVGSEIRKSSNLNMGSGLQKIDAESCEVPFQPGSPVDLPGLDSVMSLRNQQDGSCNSLSNDRPSSEKLKDQLPPPPPLPPAQWRMLKPSITSQADNDANIFNNVSHLDHLQAIIFTSSRQQGVRSPSLPSVFQQDEAKVNGQRKLNDVLASKEVDVREELLCEIRNKKHEQPKINGHNKLNIERTIHKEVDERDELLHQIRNKSFNLRRTMTSKPAPIPRSSTTVTNANVVAILEKATAIRQAFVGSDEGGDDDRWSDV